MWKMFCALQLRPHRLRQGVGGPPEEPEKKSKFHDHI